MSKFSLHDLEKYVFPFFDNDDHDVILGAAFGEDVALTRIGDDDELVRMWTLYPRDG